MGGGLRRSRICLPRCRYLRLAPARKGRRPRRPAVAGLPGFVRRSCSAWPIATAFDTARTVTSTAQRIISRGHRPRTIGTGAPPLSFYQRRAGVEARPYGVWVARVDWQRYYAAPTLHQPLSHGALRRDSSPFRGAEGWVEVCGVCASVYHDADTVVFLPPVRGGVLDAPRLRDCRGALDAPVRRDLLHPRHLRCARLCLPHIPAGTARAPLV